MKSKNEDLKFKYKMTLYSAIKEIINEYYTSTDVDEPSIITRKYIIEKLCTSYKFKMSVFNEPHKNGYTYYSINTLDNIRNILEKVGFLGKVYKPNTNQEKIIFGKYHINKEIPEELSYNRLRKIYCALQDKIKEYYCDNIHYPDAINLKLIQIEILKQFNI